MIIHPRIYKIDTTTHMEVIVRQTGGVIAFLLPLKESLLCAVPATRRDQIKVIWCFIIPHGVHFSGVCFIRLLELIL